jgi:hypothetical protein
MTQMTQMKKSLRLRQSINEPLILQSHALFLICVHLCHLWTTLPISRMKNSPQMTQMTQMKKSARLRQSINESPILQGHVLPLIEALFNNQTRLNGNFSSIVYT